MAEASGIDERQRSAGKLLAKRDAVRPDWRCGEAGGGNGRASAAHGRGDGDHALAASRRIVFPNREVVASREP